MVRAYGIRENEYEENVKYEMNGDRVLYIYINMYLAARYVFSSSSSMQ